MSFDLLTPERPERCCATCSRWVARGRDGEAWCRVRQAALPVALTAAVCISYERERGESFAVELYAQLAGGGVAAGAE